MTTTEKDVRSKTNASSETDSIIPSESSFVEVSPLVYQTSAIEEDDYSHNSSRQNYDGRRPDTPAGRTLPGGLVGIVGVGGLGGGKGPPIDRSEFFVVRCTFSTIYLMM